MKEKLMKSAREFAEKMNVTEKDFEHAPEVLEEGFALLRPSRAFATEICRQNDLKVESTELALMCLSPRFSGGRSYSLPHRHARASLTAVVPLTRGGTFLPEGDGDKLVLNEDSCFIDGEEPHAFGMHEQKPFIAALAVVNLESSAPPIRKEEGEYATSILEVLEHDEQSMRVAA